MRTRYRYQVSKTSLTGLVRSRVLDVGNGHAGERGRIKRQPGHPSDASRHWRRARCHSVLDWAERRVRHCVIGMDLASRVRVCMGLRRGSEQASEVTDALAGTPTSRPQKIDQLEPRGPNLIPEACSRGGLGMQSEVRGGCNCSTFIAHRPSPIASD